MVKRKDNKGRILRDNEYQKSDGRYEYRYSDGNGGKLLPRPPGRSRGRRR